MNTRNSKLTAVIFLLVIFTFGAGTALKCYPECEKIFQNNSIHAMIEETEASVQRNFKSRNNWINLNGLFQRAVGTTIVRDAGGTTVYKLKNGQIMYGQEERDAAHFSQNLKALYDLAESCGTDFLYVQLPFKIKDDDQMPPGAEEFANDNARRILGGLAGQGVPYLDLRAEIAEEGMDYNTLFFNTDHHWKPATALWAAGKIWNELSRRYGYMVDETLFNMENYNIETKEKWFLGSMGKRTGAWYAGSDDFDVITPKFETSYEFTAITRDGNRLERTGSFDRALLKQDYLKKDYFGINTYATYTGGDYALNTVVNNYKSDNRKILLVRDSFSCAMLPFLTMGAEEITTIDLRHYKQQSLADYVKQGGFDAVIVAYNPSAFTEAQFGFF